MKIILLKTYDSLGQVGEIINVKAGYARNYLIPNKIAQIANDNNIPVILVDSLVNSSRF